MARGCYGRFKKTENENLKGTTEDRRIGKDFAEKAETHERL